LNFPIWLNEVVQKRLEAISLELEQDNTVHLEQAGFDVVFHLFMKDLSQVKKNQFFQLEDSWTRLEGLEKEWIYKQGVKDGTQLIVSLLR
jgi:hypothetical protein